MEVVKGNQVDLSLWEGILQESKYASPFQTPEFLNFYNSVKGFSADVFAVEEGNRYTSLVVVTIQKEKGLKGYFSRRGIIYGGPLLIENNIPSLTLLMDYIVSYYRSTLIYLEIRNFFDYSFYMDIFSKSKWRFVPYLNITLNIENHSIPDLLSGMKYNRRREIKLSLERDAIYKDCEDEEELTKVYAILKDLYVTRVKLPLPDYPFFKALWRSKVGKVFVVLHNGKIIGGSFCTILENHSIYTMYYCGLRNYNKKIFPTHLAVLAALNYAVDHQCKYLDFMGVGLKGDEYGVRDYKQEFGGEFNEYGRFRTILNPLLFKIGEMGLKVQQKILK